MDPLAPQACTIFAVPNAMRGYLFLHMHIKTVYKIMFPGIYLYTEHLTVHLFIIFVFKETQTPILVRLAGKH